MPDRGLQEALSAVGGVTELARQIGISQPVVSNWIRIPAERVVAVEAATGITRVALRPDHNGDLDTTGLDDVDLVCARAYALLGNLLQRVPGADLLSRLAQLRGNASPLGLAVIEIAAAAHDASIKDIECEFFELGIGRGEIVPHASFYLTGFLHERPLARLREVLLRLGIERADGVPEPEDHAGILCEIVAGLGSGELPAPAGSDRLIYEKHLALWIGRFFADIEAATAARFYRHVGTFGCLFPQIQSETSPSPADRRARSKRNPNEDQTDERNGRRPS
jgi:TorA maturation chaperone TorD/DNA-binding transcriptional regulator YdaS (Cro superfamily)